MEEKVFEEFAHKMQAEKLKRQKFYESQPFKQNFR